MTACSRLVDGRRVNERRAMRVARLSFATCKEIRDSQPSKRRRVGNATHLATMCSRNCVFSAAGRPTFKTERLRPARCSCKIAHQRGGPKSAPVPSWASYLTSLELAGHEFSEGHVRLFAPPAWLRRRCAKLRGHNFVFRTRACRGLESLILAVPLFSQ